jgi:hypothetical protein
VGSNPTLIPTNLKQMKTYTETTLSDFQAWSGGKDTQEIILEHGKEKDFDYLMEELYPDGLSETQLNDILWFESDWLFENLGINLDEEE